MKAKITRTILPNAESYFMVKTIMPDGNESTISCFYFKENTPPDSVWNEQKNFAAALEIAHRLESGEALNKTTVVYETPVEEASQIETNLK